MKLHNAISKLERAGFNIEERVSGRNYIATQKGKETIEINADSEKEVYAIFHIWDGDKQIQKNLAQAIKFA